MAIKKTNEYKDIFAYATRNKFRFESPRGSLTVEDLWDLPMRGSLSLDAVAKKVNSSIQRQKEESFVDDTPVIDFATNIKLEVVKAIISVRKEEIEQKAAEHARMERRRKLLNLLDQKNSESDAQMSRDEILKELESL